MGTSRKPQPHHVVTIRYNEKYKEYIPNCNLCGILGRYDSWVRANNRRSTHLRGQDAGAD